MGAMLKISSKSITYVKFYLTIDGLFCDEEMSHIHRHDQVD
jgi:hypothetical protein